MKKIKTKAISSIILPVLGCLLLFGSQNAYAGYNPGHDIGGSCSNLGTWWQNVNMYQSGYSCSYAGMGWIKFEVDRDWINDGKTLWFYPAKGHAGSPIAIHQACSKTQYFYHYGFFHYFNNFSETYNGTKAVSRGFTNTGTPKRSAGAGSRKDIYVDYINGGEYGSIHHTLSIGGTQYAHAVEAEYDSSVEQKWEVAKKELGWNETYNNISTFCYDPSWEEDNEAKYIGEVKAYNSDGSQITGSTIDLGQGETSTTISFTHTISRVDTEDFSTDSRWDIHQSSDGTGATTHTGSFSGAAGTSQNVQTTTRAVTVGEGGSVTVCSSIKFDNSVKVSGSDTTRTHEGLAAKCITVRSISPPQGDCPHGYYDGTSKSKFTMNFNSSSYTNNYSTSDWSKTVWGKPGDNVQYQYELCGGADEPIANGPSNDEPTLGNPHSATFTLSGTSTNGMNGYLFGTQVSGGTVNLTTSSTGFSGYARDIDSPSVDSYACPLTGVNSKSKFYQIHANVACAPGSTVIAATDVGTKITQSLKYRYVEMEKYSVPHPHTYCASRDSNGSCTSWGTYYTYTYGTQVVGGHNGQREITASGTVNTPYNYILVPYVKHTNTNGITYPGATFNTESFVATIGRINQQVQSAAYATHTKNTTIRIVSFTTTGTPSSDVKYINNNNMTDAAICSQAGGTGNCTSLYSTTKVLNKGDNQLNGATNESASIDNGGSNVNNTIPAAVPLVNPGTRFCVAVGVYPADSHNRASTSTINDNTQTAAFQTSGTGWKVSMPACVTVAKKPTFSVESSQLVTEGNVKTSITNASNRLFGSWSEYGIIAKGNVDNMGSGAAYGYTTPYNSFTPNGTSTHAGAPRSASNKCVYSPQTIGNESCVLGGATIISSSVDSMAVARKVDEIYHMTKAEMNEGYRPEFGIVDIADASNYYGSTTRRKTISGSSKSFVNFTFGSSEACRYSNSLGRYIAPSANSATYRDAYAIVGGARVAPVYCTATGEKYWKSTTDTYLTGTTSSMSNMQMGGSGTSDLDHTTGIAKESYRNPVYIIDVDGTLVIDVNIEASNGSLGDKFLAIDQIPTAIIMAKEVIITDRVERLDAWIIAGLHGGSGKVNTCGAVGNYGKIINTADLTSETCTTPLQINGAVYAKEIVLNRTYGGGSNSIDKFIQRAEIFNLRSDAYYWAYYQSQRNRILTTVYSRELPVRY